MGDPHPATLSTDELLVACSLRHERRSGPGGQHRNKVQTAVVLKHMPTGTVAEANERRSQGENLKQAIHRLRLKLALGVRTPAADMNVPSPRWQRRTSTGRIVVSTKHDDFAALLAEALDVIAAERFELGASAAKLGVTTSQLTTFLRRHAPAWAAVNDARVQQGLRPLH